MTNVDKILKEDQENKKSRKNKNYGPKIPIYLKLNLMFSIVGLVGLIFGIVVISFIYTGTGGGNTSNNWSIFYTCLAFFGIGYLFGLIYSACLYGIYPDSAKRISLLKIHYILNFVPIANCFIWITALIILKRREYDLIETI